MFLLIEKGGLMMIPIMVGSIFGFGIVIERLIHLHRSQIDVEKFMSGIRNILKKGNVIEAISICENTPGPVASLLKEGILKHDRDKKEIKEAIQEARQHEIPLLERNLNILKVIAHVEPLLGLLGMVVGFIQCLMRIDQFHKQVYLSNIAGEMSEALIAMAAGLAVAIPIYVAYHYLVARVRGIGVDMEKAANQLVKILHNEDVN
ncbi:MAG: MotA/TolQ/ExbB proton channel family protein [Chlamydiae bacterium]|nr:MotA/TolQ/ExbB proton channel family protein [Chlamydiota bacterium]MBI3277921.1 MotA/TolQ/ExbB proton channel family protein [Chlamydiota bacterium]